MDAKTLHSVAALLDEATNKYETHPDPAFQKQIRDFCKKSDANIVWISGVLMHRLSDDHAQTRLHIVTLADQLFQRSKLFRTCLTADFTRFLELSLGFRTDKPLPGPVAIANQLRQRSLEVIEQWNDKFGSTYKQVALGYNYLKNNMAMRFPEVRARAAALEADAQDRQARSQALTQDKYQRICDGFDGHMLDMQAADTQIAEGFAILEDVSVQPAQAVATLEGADQAEDEIAWESVSPEPSDTAGGPSTEAAAASEEGLSAYSMDTIPEDLLNQAAASSSIGPGPAKQPAVVLVNVDPAVLEMLQGLEKLVAGRHLPRLQKWLKVFIKVDAGDPGSEQHAKRERMLRAALVMQTQLQASQQKLQALNQQLPDNVAASQPAAIKAAAAAAAAADDDDDQLSKQSVAVPSKQSEADLMEDLFGSEEDTLEHKEEERATLQPTPSIAKASPAEQQESSGSAAVLKHPRGADHDLPSIREASLTASSSLQPINQRLSSSAQQQQQQPNSQGLGSSAQQHQQQQQRHFDPAAAKRAISFSNSHKRKASSAKQRAQMFDDAADAAIAQTAANARLMAASTDAPDLASQQPQPHRSHEQGFDTSSDRLAGAQAAAASNAKAAKGTASQQPTQLHSAAAKAGSEDQFAARHALAAQQSAAASPHSQPAKAPVAVSHALAAQQSSSASPDSRSAKAPVAAPKLKVGSRLAANMAKLAASRKAASSAVAQPAAAGAPVPVHAEPAKQGQPGRDEGKQSAIPEDVKRKLLAQAPVVAHGNDLDYWDASNARALVNARGMEYQNHWGSHDPDVELPSEQLNAFFGTRAEYWTPSAKPQAAAGGLTPDLGQHAQQLLSTAADSRQAARQAAPDASSSRAAWGASQVRAQRAADRAHNEAVLGGTDEQVAQALAEEEHQVATKSTNEKKRKPQPTVRERLAKKLLSGKARGRTVGEIESAADARFAEVNSNQWQATRFP